MGQELFVAWQEADAPGYVEVVLTASYADELVSLLADHDVEARLSGGPARSAGDLLSTVVATAGGPAAVAAALKMFFDRHKGKRLTVDGVAAVENMSAKDIEKIVKLLAENDALRRDGLTAPEDTAEKPPTEPADESGDETVR
ncbi:hypothetical protein ACFYOT_25170 [Saccharothrix saharensis]|uniref:hypothetical protein n=1 Tax=Saccharothrix saharensis TaxID=571190 RepID=UPI00367A37BB